MFPCLPLQDPGHTPSAKNGQTRPVSGRHPSGGPDVTTTHPHLHDGLCTSYPGYLEAVLEPAAWRHLEAS